MAGNASEPGRAVTSKAMALLDAYLPRSTELSLGELARRTGLPSSTTYRLANQLVAWGGLERGAEGGYRLGIKLWELGSLARRARSPIDVISPYMQDLYEVVRENVQLAVREGQHVVYLEKLHGTGSVPNRSRDGGRLPIHATGVGKVMLAWASPQDLELLLPDELTRFTQRTVVSRERLLMELATIRQEGIAYARDELTTGVTSVAAPVRDAEGNVVAALSAVGRSGSVRQLHATAVRTTATSASRQLRDLGIVIRLDRAPRATDTADG